MGGLFTMLAVIAAGAASVYFVTSSIGTQLIRKKSVSTILKGVKTLQSTTPQTPLTIFTMLLQKKEPNKVSGSPMPITWTCYGRPDVSIRERRHNLNNLLSSWRAWNRRFIPSQ